jgi:hypothetical protein
MIDLAPKSEHPISKICNLRGFFISLGASSPNPKENEKVVSILEKGTKKRVEKSDRVGWL